MMAVAQTQHLSEKLEAVRSESGLIGMAALIMVDGEIVEQAAVGTRQKKGDTALEPTDLYHVGSIGKSISATAIARLVERGQIGWDDPLIEVAPDFASAIDPGWHEVTLDMLLSHRAGLPKLGLKQMFQGDTAETPLTQQRRTILSEMLSDPPTVALGSTFAYRNSGYALAALMAEAATGRVWEDIVIEDVAKPLSLSSAGFGAPRGQDVPWGHRKVFWLKFAMDPVNNPDNPPFMSAAGTMHMTLQDLATYGHAHLTREPTLLSDATYERLHTPQLDDYGYGWVIFEHRKWADGPVIWHNGSNTMWYALLALAPAKNMVVVMASNDGDIKKADPAFGDVLRWIGEAYPATPNEDEGSDP